MNVAELGPVMKSLVRAVETHPDAGWIDATSDGQLNSKRWLIERLGENDRFLGSILVVGGWVGVLPLFLLTQLPNLCRRVATIDIDVESARAADALLRKFVMDDLRAFSGLANAFELDYAEARFDRIREDGTRRPVRFRPNTIITTSWEHLEDPSDWFALIPKGKLVCIQANTDAELNGHISCPSGLTDLENATPFSERLCLEEQTFGSYRRLMTIGVK